MMDALKSLVGRSDAARRAVRWARRRTAAFPTRATFWDGTARPTGRYVAYMLRHWREHPSLRQESDDAYAAYDGGDVLDVGAFHGWYAVLLSPKAKPGSTFVLMEPDPEAYPALLVTLAALAETFPHLHYVALPLAAGDGRAVRAVYPLGPEGHPRFEPSSDPEDGAAARLDELASGLGLAPTFAKVDVEGAELYVLRGMERILDRRATTLMVELHPEWQPSGVTVDEAVAPLRARGFASRTLTEAPESVRTLWTPASP